MSHRVYLLIALAFVIGGPLLVTIISDALPAPEAAESATMETGENPSPMLPRVEETETMAEPIPQPAGSTDPLFDAAPTMEAQGLDIQDPTASAPVTAVAPSPAPAPAPEPPIEDEGPMEPSLLPPDIPASQHR